VQESFAVDMAKVWRRKRDMVDGLIAINRVATRRATPN
jgi:hypothetical protein